MTALSATKTSVTKAFTSSSDLQALAEELLQHATLQDDVEFTYRAGLGNHQCRDGREIEITLTIRETGVLAIK